jgi:hypothetical protein
MGHIIYVLDQFFDVNSMVDVVFEGMARVQRLRERWDFGLQ